MHQRWEHRVTFPIAFLFYILLFIYLMTAIFSTELQPTGDVIFFFFLMTRQPPKSPLFPYTTLFRSHEHGLADHVACGIHARVRRLQKLVDGDFSLRAEADADRVEPEARRVGSATRGDQQLFGARSEEHTSELQSPCNLVCRLLLEKK